MVQSWIINADGAEAPDPAATPTAKLTLLKR